MEKCREKPFYSAVLKREVRRRMCAEDIGPEEASRRYGILGSNTVREWAEEAGMPHDGTNPSPEKKAVRQKRQRTDEQRRISELEEQLGEARQRIELYRTALGLASEQLGKDFLKKLVHLQMFMNEIWTALNQTFGN